MSAITVPTSGNPTITLDTAEGCLWQAISLAQYLERDTTKNPSQFDRFTGSADRDAYELRGNWALQLQSEKLSDGTRKFKAINYLVNTGFVAGTGGTFVSTTLEEYILEVILHIFELQNTPAKNPNNRFWLTGGIDFGVSPFFASGSYKIPYTQILSPTGTTDSPLEYLED